MREHFLHDAAVAVRDDGGVVAHEAEGQLGDLDARLVRPLHKQRAVGDDVVAERGEVRVGQRRRPLLERRHEIALEQLRPRRQRDRVPLRREEFGRVCR